MNNIMITGESLLVIAIENMPQKLVFFFLLLEVIINGTVHRDFRPRRFNLSNLTGPLNDGLKYFRFWLRIHQVIQVSSSKKLTRQDLINRGVRLSNFKFE